MSSLAKSEISPSHGILDHAPWSGYQKLVVVLTATALMLDGFDNLLLGFVMPTLMAEWDVTRSAFVGVVALSVIGMSAGTIFLGMLADRFGRRPLLVLCVATFGLSTLASALAPNLLIFTVFRIVAALGLGGAFPIAAALIAEFTPLRRRSLAISTALLCLPVGGMLAGVLAAKLLPSEGWRALFVVGGVAPLVLVGVMLLALPESPNFLLRREQLRPRLVATLRRCGLAEADIPSAPPVVRAETRARPRDLLAPGFRRDTLGLWCVGFFGCVALYGVFNWAPTVLSAAGFQPAQTSLGLASFNLGGIAGALIGGWAMDRFGSRVPTFSFAVLGAATPALLALSGWPWASPAALYGGLVVLGVAICGLLPMMSALGASIYPTALRASGLGAANGIGRLGALGSALFGFGALTMGLAPFLGALAATFFFVTAALLLIRSHAPRPQPAPERCAEGAELPTSPVVNS